MHPGAGSDRSARRLDGLWSLGLLATPLLLSWVLLRPLASALDTPSPRLLLSLMAIWGAALGFHLLRQRMERQAHLAADQDAQQRLLKAVMDAATEVALIATDAQGTIQLFNTGAEQMLGLKARDAIHHLSPASFHLPEELDQRAQELSASLGLEINGFEVFTALPSRGLSEVRTWTYQHVDGRRFPVSLAVSALRDRHGRIFGYLGVAQNIQVQQAREFHLEAQAQEAQETARLTSAFLATMSHEIRTPMNAIMAMVRYLLTTNLDSEQREITEIGRKAARNLLDMLDRVLDLSKLEAGAMTLETSAFSPLSLTRDCAELWRADATAKGLAFLVALPTEVPVALGDPLRLKQVLNNLLGNALKFTTQGSITLRLQVSEEESELLLRWAVEDSGVGMTPATLHRLFRPFTQADAGITRQFGGTGLGLALSQDLVHLMGGTLSVDSLAGEGSTFTMAVRLPKA